MKKVKVEGRFIAKVLRHFPDLIGIQLDDNGWVSVEELIDKIGNTGREIDFDILQEIVKTDDKGRFSFNEDKSKLRAVQGHSVDVDLQLEATEPPEFLYHGTAVKSLDSIKRSGIEKRTRNFVHLSPNEQIAKNVGIRHGVPVVLKINTKQMYIDGFEFFVAENGVWLTDFVPYQYVVEVINPQD